MSQAHQNGLFIFRNIFKYFMVATILWFVVLNRLYESPTLFFSCYAEDGSSCPETLNGFVIKDVS